MKTKVTVIRINGHAYYLSQYKKHWYNRWKYVMNTVTNCPHLFSSPVSALLMADIGKNYEPKGIFE